MQCVVSPYIFTLYMMFYLNFPDNKDDVEAYATKPTLVITNERTLYITRQYKDTLRKRSMILMSLYNTFIRVYANQYLIE